MAQLPQGFNANQHEDMSDFSAIEETGDYNMLIDKSEWKDVKDKPSHKRLVLHFKILDGKHKGKHLFTSLNLVNSSAQAVEIAQKELATICRACGKVNINDSEELHGIPMVGHVDYKPATATNPARNNITNYKPAGAGGAAAPSTVTGAAEQGSAEPKKKPWE